MFSLAYVILPFSDTPPAEAIRASLAPFQRGSRGDLPESWLTFHDETDELRRVYEARLTFGIEESGGMRIEGGNNATWYISTSKIEDEMRRLGLQHWRVRFAETMDLNQFHGRFGRRLERHPETGAFGRWLNPLGRWDWWDLGGRFDGCIVRDRRDKPGRSVAKVSSGPNTGRTILANITDRLNEALGQEPAETFDVETDQNVELVATLLEAARAGRENAFSMALVLPPGAVEDRLRWIDTWPRLDPLETITWLSLSHEAGWEAIVSTAYARFEGHWAAAVAYHH